MADIKPEVIERVLANKFYWRQLAARIIAESSRNVPRGNTDSAWAPAPPLGQILESRLLQTRVRFSSSGNPGPRRHDIVEVTTLTSDGRLPSQRRARHLRTAWDQGRRRGQTMVQNTRDATADNQLQDHPGRSCSDVHGGTGHDDWKDQQEEEEHGPSPHIPGKPVGKVGGHAADNAYDSPADKPASPDEEEEETRRSKLPHQLGESQRYEAISIKSSSAASRLYNRHASRILKKVQR